MALSSVQNELNLSSEQKTKLRDLPGQEPGTTTVIGANGITIMRPSGTQPSAETDRQLKQLAEILKPDQMKRLKQIDLQMQGPAALRNPEVIAALGLTTEQREKLNAIIEEVDKILKPTITPTIIKVPHDSEGLKERVFGVLTPKQREKFEKMKGKPVDLKPQVIRADHNPLGVTPQPGGGNLQIRPIQPPKKNN